MQSFWLKQLARATNLAGVNTIWYLGRYTVTSRTLVNALHQETSPIKIMLFTIKLSANPAGVQDRKASGVGGSMCATLTRG